MVGFLVFSGLGAATIQKQENEDFLIKNETILVEKPVINTEDEYSIVQLNDATQLIRTGKPIIPVITKTYMLPFGTIIKNTEVNIEYKTTYLENKIKPSPAPYPLTTKPVIFNSKNNDLFDESIYQSSTLYPLKSFEVDYGVGINNDDRVTMINIRCNAQYSPVNDYINIPRRIEITIEYTEPKTPLITASDYDLLIITPEKFKDEMNRLKDHKNGIGMNTKIITLSSIYQDYDGYADWEEVKMCMKDEIVNHNPTYAILVGGHKAQNR